MKTLLEKLNTLQKEMEKIAADVARLETQKTEIEHDPCIDYDIEMHTHFDAMLAECGNPQLKEDDEPAYNENFNNWLDSILRDGSISNYIEDYAGVVESLENADLYKSDIEDALDSLEEALSTLNLMIN